MVNQWGTNDSSCDIGPTPFGDSQVDVRDLTVLAEYIGKPLADPTLVAHWALDEADGDVAWGQWWQARCSGCRWCDVAAGDGCYQRVP